MSPQPHLVVAGGGPAGIMAAVEAHRRGMRVTIVDENTTVGGQYFRSRQTAVSPGSPGYLARNAPDVRVLAGTSIVDAPAEGRLTVWAERGSAEDLAYDRLVVSTGAYDRTVAIPGWTLPGVLTAGGAHTLAKVHAVTPGHRIVVAGAGPFLLPVADVLAAKGCRVTVVEATRFRSSLRGVPTMARDPEILLQAIGYLGRLTVRRLAPPIRPDRDRHSRPRSGRVGHDPAGGLQLAADRGIRAGAGGRRRLSRLRVRSAARPRPAPRAARSPTRTTRPTCRSSPTTGCEPLDRGSTRPAR